MVALNKKEETTAEFTKSYMSKLQERIYALKTLIRLNTKSISGIVTLRFLNTMWRELVISSQCKEESDLMCKWLQELTDKEKDEQFFLLL